ncbi:carbon-nitrogen hydrolase family protein [Vibrio ouci]|uniref:Carbon-nitrogen hydrolase family protein n=1 Tax=Vibrio ouci TaxID=2499078 RepID=A0A4Y8W9V0_9VIBR|nr:carbon-nitrogen hydrolase family protein [Vibrio ouci]TFH89426.1 carbon-nitrogen hydrolase family protein [Vibrio ouci]
MKFALLQFPVSRDPNDNYAQIKQAIRDAQQQGAQVLVTQECALSGYPPVEIRSVAEIDFEQQAAAFEEIVQLVKDKQMHVFLGLIRPCGDKVANSVAIISPSGEVQYYDKRALWGWDADNFVSESDFNGIVEIHGVRIGVRVCYEIRFPEYFRELYREQVDVAIVSLCDVQPVPDAHRLSLIKSHLLTRAIENVLTVISVNASTFAQTAPTGVIDPLGNTLVEAARDQASLTYFNYQRGEYGFGAKGIIAYSDKLLGRAL